MNLTASQEEMVSLLLTSVGAKVGKREPGWQDGPSPQYASPPRLAYLQLIEVICAIFPRQALHNARHRGVAQTGTYGGESSWLTAQKLYRGPMSPHGLQLVLCRRVPQFTPTGFTPRSPSHSLPAQTGGYVCTSA